LMILLGFRKPVVFIGCPPALEVVEKLSKRCVIYERSDLYEEMPGWKKDTTATTSYSRLPAAARNYLKRIQKLVGTRIVLVSVGSDRKQTFPKGV